LSDAPDGGIVGKGGCHRPHLTTWHISGIGSARSRSKLSKLPLDVAGIEILEEPKDFEKKIENELAEYGRQANLPGFRPGKIPMPVLKQRFGSSVRGKVLFTITGHKVRLQYE